MVSSRKINIPFKDLDGAAIGARLKAERERMGLSQKDVAIALEFRSSMAVSKHEACRIPKSAVLQKYSCLYGRSVEWFLYGEDASLYEPRVRDPRLPYGELSDSDKKVLREFYEFLRDADEGRKEHLRRQMKYLLGKLDRTK